MADDSGVRPANDSGGSAYGRVAARLDQSFELISTTEHLEATRGGQALQLTVKPESHPVALVEDPDTGVLSWAWPDVRASRGAPAGPGTTFVVSGATDRGAFSMVGKKVVRLLTPKFVDEAIEVVGGRLVASWEAKYRPDRLIRFEPETVDLPDDSRDLLVTRDAFGDEPALLLLHGLAARTRSGFDGLRGRGLSRLNTKYGSRIVGYDHASLSRGPDDNAKELLDRLVSLHRERELPPIDVVGHGRGGLVARALLAEIERSQAPIRLGRVSCVGTPNLGQPLADPAQLRAYVDRLTNLIGWLPLGGVEDVVDGILTTVAHLALGVVAGLEGITRMAPDSALLSGLNSPAAVAAASGRLYAIASNYSPRAGAPLAAQAKVLASGQLLRGPNDLLTTVESTFGQPDAPIVPTGHQLLFGDAHGVNHATYFEHPATVDFIVDTTVAARGGPPVTSETWLPAIHDEDGTIVTISVSHCSLEESQYAVMVGTYSNESLAGAERFLDRQLKGELSARFEIDRYPSDLGTSLFLSAEDEGAVVSDPPGAYVVGLGSTISLGRPELARTVRQALVDRCLQLYHAAPGVQAGGVIEVGVSSTLLGVRNNDGLTVTESVAGIVEGVFEANRALVRYETSRSDDPTPVRITALEIVERYADRADRAVLAVRSLSSLVRLGPGYDELQHLTVRSDKRGGLPAGSAVNDNPQDWQRFVITGQGGAPATASGPRVMRLEITALGSDARADRVSHELDVGVVDALVERLGQNRSDKSASATLFNFLVPDEIRPKFQTASAVQFVVDAATANFPWELLSAPRAGQLRRLAESTSVVRQFTESEDRRLAPVRAKTQKALVIAAGNLTTMPKLPGVFEEAEVVEAALQTKSKLTVKVVDDADDVFDAASLMIDTFGDYRVLHIASHGVYVADDPARTGAMLTDDIVLTAGKIRLLPQVPDLVFLNCCNLAQIGSNRMAAGLARELMAIGVRAVIAAGWPVGDAAAVAFAKTFYESFLAGTTFGEAVARARLACASVGGGETWAAYQCYGDPTLLFGTTQSSSGGNEVDPASRDDLMRRLKALEVQAGDLGRPGETGLQARRAAMLATLQHLADWADDHGEGHPDVQRQIATVARVLNDVEYAAERFRRMIAVAPRQAGKKYTAASVRLKDKDSSAVDLQQAANCLARAAYQRFSHPPAEPDSSGLPTPNDDMELAAALAEAACRMIGDRECHGIRGGVYRRWALVDPDHRTAYLEVALASYRDAYEIDRRRKKKKSGKEPPPGGYGYENARQFAALLHQDVIAASAPPPPPPSEQRRRTDERRSLAADFWECAARGDQLLSELMLQTTPEAAGRIADRMIEAYESAFMTRSTYAERNSSLDQIRGLRDLARSDPTMKVVEDQLERACGELERWEQVNLPAEDSPTARSVAPASGVRGAGAAVVTVRALPAGKGDCLVLEYPGTDGAAHRIVIDGGLGSAFDEGFGAFAAGQGPGPVPADVLVVTHIDADHVGGAIKMLQQPAVAPADVWFNGLEQLLQVRGVAQGDEFSKLIPVELRNRVVGGRPLVVPEGGPLNVFQLAGRAHCTLLSPSPATLQKLLTMWEGHTKRGEELLAPEALAELFDAEEPTDRGDAGAPRFGSDPSVPNGSSIAFLLEVGGRSLLLTGDAHAGVLQSSIERLLENRRLSRLPVDLFKVSHHSSRNNISAALLELVDCAAFLVCTSGNHSHPDVEGLRLMRLKFPKARFFFTDDTPAVRNAIQSAGIERTELPAPGVALTMALPPKPASGTDDPWVATDPGAATES